MVSSPKYSATAGWLPYIRVGRDMLYIKLCHTSARRASTNSPFFAPKPPRFLAQRTKGALQRAVLGRNRPKQGQICKKNLASRVGLCII
ncbi:hypothetical protein SUBVAR_06518 [Subdoligranulum variabile DSM 15176]|uniref:Uncharacterized protein n=1 Tax=Subdoligranulum variabile DSM 15176 TaxID=411471 RepID=D1PQ50_9FIRM|nr:hypothetical protein SUBVAR_06518 [Subdoligranulum variabile DSM 15176]